METANYKNNFAMQQGHGHLELSILCRREILALARCKASEGAVQAAGIGICSGFTVFFDDYCTCLEASMMAKPALWRVSEDKFQPKGSGHDGPFSQNLASSHL